MKKDHLGVAEIKPFAKNYSSYSYELTLKHITKVMENIIGNIKSKMPIQTLILRLMSQIYHRVR